MGTNEWQKPLGRTALLCQTGPAIEHLEAVFVFAPALALQAKDLSHLAPVPTQVGIEVWTGEEMTPLQTAMAVLHLLTGLPGAAISLLVFTKEFQIGPRDGRMVFAEHDHLPSGSLDQASKVVIAAWAASLLRIRPVQSPSVNTALSGLTSVCSCRIGHGCTTMPVCTS